MNAPFFIISLAIITLLYFVFVFVRVMGRYIDKMNSEEGNATPLGLFLLALLLLSPFFLLIKYVAPLLINN